jgi:hypothetical protein
MKGNERREKTRKGKLSFKNNFLDATMTMTMTGSK